MHALRIGWAFVWAGPGRQTRTWRSHPRQTPPRRRRGSEAERLAGSMVLSARTKRFKCCQSLSQRAQRTCQIRCSRGSQTSDRTISDSQARIDLFYLFVPSTASAAELSAASSAGLTAPCKGCLVASPTRNQLVTQCAVCATELGLSSGKKCGRPQHARYCRGSLPGAALERRRARPALQKNKSRRRRASKAEHEVRENRSGRGRGMLTFTTTKSRSPLHLHAGPSLEDQGGARAGVRAAERRASRTCRAWRSRRRFWSRGGRENNLDWMSLNARWERWYACSLCEQKYHGVVNCALGWACWKACRAGRRRTGSRSAMSQLGAGLYEATRYEDALPVMEAELSMKRRHGASGSGCSLFRTILRPRILRSDGPEEALQIKRDAYSGCVICLARNMKRPSVANNYAPALVDLERLEEEARRCCARTIPVTRRVLSDSSRTTLVQRCNYAESLYEDPEATLDDLREAVTTLEEVERIARRVLGGAHPLTVDIEGELRESPTRHAREAQESGVVTVTLHPQAWKR